MIVHRAMTAVLGSHLDDLSVVRWKVSYEMARQPGGWQCNCDPYHDLTLTFGRTRDKKLAEAPRLKRERDLPSVEFLEA